MREMALTALLFAVAVAQLHQSQAQEAVTQGAPFAFALSQISSVCAVGLDSWLHPHLHPETLSSFSFTYIHITHSIPKITRCSNDVCPAH